MAVNMLKVCRLVWWELRCCAVILKDVHQSLVPGVCQELDGLCGFLALMSSN